MAALTLGGAGANPDFDVVIIGNQAVPIGPDTNPTCTAIPPQVACGVFLSP